MVAGIPKGSTRQREHTGLGFGVFDSSAACGVRSGRGVDFGDDEGHTGDDKTSARRRGENGRGRHRQERTMN